ncbi:polyamine ABC transporter substrate-binding protein [Enterovirga sp.]|jgi:putrescine transport system substrate-binding protein|uniref:polyamine ABC transporter substrate-binding protein n=1 Tax=Enterovirga sp. TaxID=2026350 RepID=UPI00260C198A|nr:polyamine ABC transporter substrate-binding protein [Enterovirga sp.]MDB5590843.1 spermidine/putrescine transporter substrate-binding protein [Enterovirga sp.]
MRLRPVLAALVLLASSFAAAAQDRVVHVYNWSDYIDPKMLESFTKDTGIRVVYDTYDNNEIVETKLLAGKSGYDIVVPSGAFLQRLIKAGVFQKLDKTKLPNLKYAWPEIVNRLAAFDPGNQYAVDYMWGTTGIGVNVAKVRERLGDMPAATWDVVLKPEIAAKLKDCGIHMLDSPEDMMPGVLKAIGLEPDSKAEADLRRAAETLMAVRGNIAKFHSSEYINALANGDICVAVGFSGDIIQARKRAEEAGKGVEIAYHIPREGALMWFDAFAIPAEAEHPAEAYAFIDYMLRPEVAAANTNFVAYAGGNLAAKDLVKPEILKDAGIFPDEATMARLFTNTAYDEATQRIVTRLWTRIRTGR